MEKRIPFPEPDKRTCAEMVHDQNVRLEGRVDRNCISYWFPRIAAAGLPVPKTRIFQMPEAVQVECWDRIDRMVEGDPPGWGAFVNYAEMLSDEIGYPVFLRSGHTSGKFEWSRTCYVTDRAKLGEHIFSILYFSECVGMFGELPWRIWALREYLPIKPFGSCPSYEGMPLCREFRFFVEDGEVKCWHPYWPPESLERGGVEMSADKYRELCRLDDPAELMQIAAKAGAACGGAWSVDLLETERGWFLTDMAEARTSYHWPECERLAANVLSTEAV